MNPAATSTLPSAPAVLADAMAVARRVMRAISQGKGASLLRFGDTGGRVLASPQPGSPEWVYLQRFLGHDITPGQVDWLGERIVEAAAQADVVGLRTDLLGPPLPPDALAYPDEALQALMLEHYPIRLAEREVITAQSARRLAETRAAMERFRFRPDAVLTHAWMHLDLAEIGFISALLRRARSVALVTSAVRRPVVMRMRHLMGRRLRYYECPGYPSEERIYGADHGFLWDRWRMMTDVIAPAWPGEPLLISGGIWTKPIATAFRNRGGVAIDLGSVLDYFDNAATRPTVLSDRYGSGTRVPPSLTLDAQFERTERLSDFA